MSGHLPSAPQEGKRRKGGGCKGGGRVKVYLHAVINEEAALFTDTASTCTFENLKKRTGAIVEFHPSPSPVPGMKIIIIRGVPSQFEAAIRLINQNSSSKALLSEQAQEFWVQWVKYAFPRLDSDAYFLPPVYVNRVPMVRELTHGLEVLVLRPAPGQADQSNQSATTKSAASQPSPVYDSDVRDDAARQRVLCCLEKMFEEKKEVLIAVSQLSFGQYLGEPCYAAAAAQLPRPASLPSALPRNWKQGDFDVLLIHRHHGFVVCDLRTIGDNTKTLNMSQKDIEHNISMKLKDAVSQLDKAEAMLSHLVSDIAPGLRITKTIAFPNLTTCHVQQAISGDTQLTQDLCQCLGTTTDPADIADVCLCSDQLSDPTTPWEVNSNVLRELGHWWQRYVAGAGPDSLMTPGVYKTLVARFCGPATTVSVPCTRPPRVSVKTLGQAVWCTGECYTAVITLFPEQIHLLNTAPPTLFVTGPPGTGKTVVLLMTGIKWLRCGQHVYIVSTCYESRAARIMLYHLLLQTVKTQQSEGVSPGQPHLLQYDLADDKIVEKAVNDLSQGAREGLLYVIADEVGLREFLLQAAHTSSSSPPLGSMLLPWIRTHQLATRPLRSPPAVVREVEQNKYITDRDVLPYSSRGVPDHTDGPPVKRLNHRGQGHTVLCPGDCVTCGREVASFLRSLRVGINENVSATSIPVTSTSGNTRPTSLQWRDVLVLYWYDASENTGMVKGLKEAGIPVRVMNDDDIEDVATTRSDVVWVANGHRVRGLERKVVVCLNDDYDSLNYELFPITSDFRFHLMSRCTSQLVIVSPERLTG